MKAFALPVSVIAAYNGEDFGKNIAEQIKSGFNSGLSSLEQGSNISLPDKNLSDDWDEYFYIDDVHDKEAEFTEIEKIPDGTKPIKSFTMMPSKYHEGYDGVYVVNEDNIKFDIKKLLSEDVELDINSNSDEPQVLILHTHATEAYNEERVNYYYPKNEYRSEDNSKNMIHIGAIVAEKLENAGYRTIHIYTQHDNPDYNKSYTNSNNTIKTYLKKYPSIKVVLDVHRDTLITDNGTKYRPITQINGETSAQVMLLMGAGSETYPHKDWQKNFKFALNIQKRANELYPNLMRSILLRDSRYNQHLSTGALLVEIGTCGNTIEEAQRAASYFTDALIDILDSVKD